MGSSCLLNPHLAALPRSSAQRPTHSILLPHPLLLKSLMSALLFCLGLCLSLLPCLAPFSPQTPYLFVPSPLFPLGEVWPNSALRSIQGAGTSVNGQGQGICLVPFSPSQISPGPESLHQAALGLMCVQVALWPVNTCSPPLNCRESGLKDGVTVPAWAFRRAPGRLGSSPAASCSLN